MHILPVSVLRYTTVYLKLIDKIQYLHDGFDNKAKEFANILKMGRTQLQDAVPMTVGQEFKAFAVLLEEEVRNLKRTAGLLLEVNLVLLQSVLV